MPVEERRTSVEEDRMSPYLYVQACSLTPGTQTNTSSESYESAESGGPSPRSTVVADQPGDDSGTVIGKGCELVCLAVQCTRNSTLRTVFRNSEHKTAVRIVYGRCFPSPWGCAKVHWEFRQFADTRSIRTVSDMDHCCSIEGLPPFIL